MSNRFKCKNPTKHNWDILSVGKLSYGGLFISIKLFIPESPHLTGFFKGSQMLQPNSEYRSNVLWMRGTTWMQKELWNPFACDIDQRFHMKVKCLNGGASFWVKLPLYRAKFQSNPWGMPGGVGERDGQFWNWLVHYSLCEWDSSSLQDSLSLLMDILTSWC